VLAIRQYRAWDEHYVCEYDDLINIVHRKTEYKEEQQSKVKLKQYRNLRRWYFLSTHKYPRNLKMDKFVSHDYLGNLIIDNHIIKSFDIVPSSYSDFKEMNEKNSISIKLFNIQSDTIDKEDEVEFKMRNFFKDDAFLIVFGGWIPCSFIKKNTILIVDRNIVTEIINRYENGKQKKITPYDSFDTVFLNNKSISIDISAYVIEANIREIPTDDLIEQQILSVKKSLKKALPNLKINSYPGGDSYYLRLKNALKPLMKNRMDFLQKITPALNKQFNQKSRESAIRNLFETAKKTSLEKKDLVIILALLRISMIDKKNAAQLVLKDSQNYTKEKAFNAICDLSAIELLINLQNTHTKNNSFYNLAFITKDKGLSLFSSLFSSPEISKSNEESLTIKSNLPSYIFGDDDIFIKKYEKWLNE
jgi:hypothetical protein